MAYIITIALIILAILIAYFFRFIIGKIFDVFNYIHHISKNPNNGQLSTASNDINDKKYDDYNENFQNAREKVNSIFNNPEANINTESLGAAKQREHSSYNEIWEIAGQYGDSIPTKLTVPGIYPNSVLPYTREEIKLALATLILIEHNPAAIEIICINYYTLDMFVPDEVYRIMADTFGEPDSEDTQQNSDVMANTAIQNFDNNVNEEIIQTWERTMNLLREREYSSTIELLALRRIAGLDVEFYLKRLDELSRDKTEVD